MFRKPGIRIYAAIVAMILAGFLPAPTVAQTNPDDYYLGTHMMLQ